MKKKAKIIASDEVWGIPVPLSVAEMSKKLCKEDFDAPWFKEFLEHHKLEMPTTERIAEFDAKTSAGFKLNLLTGEYYR